MKLHIGGTEAKDDWKILNIQKLEGVDFIGDITNLVQFGNDSIEEIYASHVVEHVQQDRVLETFRGIHRILKPGGKFYCSVPDLDVLCHMFLNPQFSIDAKFHVMKMMFGGQTDPFDFHYFGWNQAFLVEFLRMAGFQSFQRVESFNLFNDTSNFRPHGILISLNLVSTK